MARIEAICTSSEKGTSKIECGQAEIRAGHGIVGDAHAGDWHRQISILPLERIMDFNARGASVRFGDFGENLVVSGVDFPTLSVGDRLHCDGVVLELTQLGKECHTRCHIFQRMGDCIMPRHGLFAMAVIGGELHVGDAVAVEKVVLRGSTNTLSKRSNRSMICF